MVNFYNQQNRDNHSESAGRAASLPQNVSAKSAKANINKYTDPTGEFSGEEFKWGIWFVKNKLLLYRLLIISLIIFCAGTVGFSLWQGANFLIYDFTVKPQQDLQLARATNYAALQPQFSPAPLEILNSFVLPGGTNKVDAVAEMANPNSRFVVRFDYYFNFGGQKTETRSALVLPLASKPVAVLGLDNSVYQGGGELVIENIKWSRVSAHEVSDTLSWQTERLNFLVENFVFTPAGGLNNPSANTITFDLKNDSPFGFKNPQFLLGLYQGGTMVGITQFDLTDFASQETRLMDLRNFVPGLIADEIKLFPVIDLYDKTVYLPPKKE
ncbi:MAG: hypothetical protein PHD72_01810 [Patescibacteria group bacterium]|nr:hypothetical protein [Patescibacteria group bacterium]